MMKSCSGAGCVVCGGRMRLVGLAVGILRPSRRARVAEKYLVAMLVGWHGATTRALVVKVLVVRATGSRDMVPTNF